MTVVVRRAETSVDLGRGEDETAALAQRDDLVHGHFGCRVSCHLAANAIEAPAGGASPRAIIALTMPIYEYKCENGHHFDVIQSMSEDPVTECTECGAPVQRVLHSPAIHFKGSGFYNTDYGTKSRNKGKEAAAASEKASKSSDSSSSDSGSGKSSDSKSGSSGDSGSSGSSSSSSDSGSSKPAASSAKSSD